MTLLILAAAWLCGLGLVAAGFGDAPLVAVAIGLGVGAGLVLMKERRGAGLVLASTLLFALGGARLEGALPPDRPEGVALFNDGAKVLVRAMVDQEPEDREASQRLVLKVQEVNAGEGWQRSSGKVLATLRPFPRFDYGDILELSGRLETPPSFDSFDYREYLARRGITSTAGFPEVKRIGSGGGSSLTARIIHLRDRLGDSLARALPEPEGALARGMLLGQRASIPADVTDDFNRAGISHLIAISGSNVSIVAAVAVASLAWGLGRRRAVWAAIVLVPAFVLLVGASPSVMRAGVMGVVMLGAVLAGRPGSALTAVAFAAALLTAVWPLAVLDVAFQLSFAATLGLIILEPPLRERLTAAAGRVLPGSAGTWLAESVSVTAAASIAVFPITAANFERVSLIAIPANMVAVPLFTATLVTSGITAAAGLVSGSLGALAGRFAEVPLWALVQTARAFASAPLASMSLHGIGVPAAAAIYGGIGLLCIALSRRRPIPLEDSIQRLPLGFVLPVASLVFVAATFLWWDFLFPGGGRLQVTVMDVGQGDSILIETPAGQRILVDGGPSGAATLRDLSHELPRGAKRIDLMVMTHPQEDHVAGLVDVADRYGVRQAVVSGTSSQIGAYRAWIAETEARQIPISTILAGETADLGHGVRLEVLSPTLPYLTSTEDDLNNNAVVLRLSYGSVSFLLTADLGPEGEARLLGEGGDLHATVLKVGHHGSATSSTAEFLTAVRPSIAAISVGEDNGYGHPSPTTLLRLAGVPIYRTDRNGAIRFETDGRHLYVKPDHGSYQVVPVSAR